MATYKSIWQRIQIYGNVFVYVAIYCTKHQKKRGIFIWIARPKQAPPNCGRRQNGNKSKTVSPCGFPPEPVKPCGTQRKEPGNLSTPTHCRRSVSGSQEIAEIVTDSPPARSACLWSSLSATACGWTTPGGKSPAHGLQQPHAYGFPAPCPFRRYPARPPIQASPCNALVTPWMPRSAVFIAAV